MREIKFRAWNNSLKSMHDVSELHLDTDGKLKEISRFKTILMQYIGFKDVEGCEIYEGDILHKLDPVCWNPFAVTYSEFSACFIAGGTLGRESIRREELVVIGNVYQNPELLENKA